MVSQTSSLELLVAGRTQLVQYFETMVPKPVTLLKAYKLNKNQQKTIEHLRPFFLNSKVETSMTNCSSTVHNLSFPRVTLCFFISSTWNIYKVDTKLILLTCNSASYLQAI